jgi:hypothetical protein
MSMASDRLRLKFEWSRFIVLTELAECVLGLLDATAQTHTRPFASHPFMLASIADFFGEANAGDAYRAAERLGSSHSTVVVPRSVHINPLLFSFRCGSSPSLGPLLFKFSNQPAILAASNAYQHRIDLTPARIGNEQDAPSDGFPFL